MPKRARIMMRYRCTIQRDTTKVVDPLGHPGTPEYTTVFTDLPCYIWSEEERRNPMILWNSQVSAAFERTKGIVPLGTELVEDDIMVSNTDRQGNDYFTGRYIIRGINPRVDHLELYLERYDVRTAS